ncbi:cytochrome-c oxidase, cbb3-type subunit III [Saccharophagus sp. K07]|nr:cytochrome-c oxidase, cbb3-type subunit III [Saccharophagus sp. K07]
MGLTLACIALVTWVLFANRKVAIKDDEEPENRTTGHVYDGIEEYDNPLPKWWFQLFVGTLVFTAVYLVIYPGLGSFPGVTGWTSLNQLEREQDKARDVHSEIYSAFLQTPIEELAQDNAAMKMAVRLFANNCAVCHGADGGGNYGFPNLTDKDWLYGGSADKIKETITHGRAGSMPAWGPIIGEPNVLAVSEYVLSLSNQEHDKDLAAKGSAVFQQNCIACHGVDGTGNQALGAPNLADNIWLYDGSREGIAYSVRNGRANVMPAQKDMLQEEKIHLLAAYVYSLSLEN